MVSTLAICGIGKGRTAQVLGIWSLLGFPYTPGPFASPYGSPMAPEEEKEWLKSQADVIHQQIDQINSRIAELEKE